MSTTFQAPRKPHVVVVIAVIWIAAFLVSFDFAAVTVALPTIARSFEVGTGLASWASLSYMLVMVALTLIARPIMGRLSPQLALTGSLGGIWPRSACSLAGVDPEHRLANADPVREESQPR